MHKEFDEETQHPDHMARNAGHAPALYSGYLSGTWFNLIN